MTAVLDEVTGLASTGQEGPALKRAVLYLRVSTTAQATRGGEAEGYSIPAQRTACERKARELGAEVVGRYVDAGQSGTSAKRDDLQAMLTRLMEQRDVDYVIVHKLDRLARNRYDDVTITFAIRQAGAQLVSATENIDETPAGALVHGIMSSIAEFYSRNLAAEVVKGALQKAQNGGTPTRAPIGYLNERRTVDGVERRTVAIDPERAPFVRWAFEAYATGNYSLRRLAAELEAMGLRTRPTPKHPAQPIPLKGLNALLRNRYYLGVVSYRGVQYDGKHERLIDQDTFDRVQAVLTAHNSAGEKSWRHHHYLKGSLYCGHCGGRLCLTKSRGRGGSYSYFFCLRRQQGANCLQPYVPEDIVEAAVERYYATVHLPQPVAIKLRAAVETALAAERQLGQREVTRQQRRIVQLNSERAKLLEAHYAGAIPLDLLRSEQERIAKETATAERLLAANQKLFAEIDDMLTKTLDLIVNCQAAYLYAGPQVRRELNQFFFEKLLVEDDEMNLSVPTGTVGLLRSGQELIDRLEQESGNPGPHCLGQGSNVRTLVEIVRHLSNPVVAERVAWLYERIGRK